MSTYTWNRSLEERMKKMIDNVKKGFQKKHWQAYDILVAENKKIGTLFPKIIKKERKPYLLVCTAYSGSGKTTLWNRLQKEQGYVMIDSDIVRGTVLGNKRNDPIEEAKVTKVMIELRDYYLQYWYDTIITGCNVDNEYRKVFLTTWEEVEWKVLVHLKTSRQVLNDRRGKWVLEFMDSLWQDTDTNLTFMKEITYIQLTSENKEDMDSNVQYISKICQG